MVRITLRRSLIGTKPEQRAAAATLGLRRLGQSVVRPLRPEVEGLIRRLAHLVEVTPEGQVPGGGKGDATADR